MADSMCLLLTWFLASGSATDWIDVDGYRKGAVECAACGGTGLDVDAVLESLRIIVRVICLEPETVVASEAMSSSTFFQGSVPQAIAEAQIKTRVLVVFISGEDEESLKLEQVTWQDSKVIKEVQRGCVALKIAEGSTDALNFSTVYPIRRVPTVSVIGFTGALLQQHEGYITPEEFVAGLQQVLATYTPQNVAAAGAIATILSSAHLAQTDTIPATAEGESGTTACLRESSTEPVDDSASALGRGFSPPPIGRDSLNVDPSERKRAGAGATDLSESEGATSSAPSVGGATLDSQALEAIKATEGMKAADKAKAISQQAHSDSKLIEISLNKTSKERIGPFLLQIRLTNSENIRGEFEATNTLRDVKIFVDKNRTDGNKSYSFVIPFPRRSLTPDDLDQSLAQLELGPRSTVMIVPNRMTSEGSSWSCATASGTTEATSTPGGVSFIWRVLSYLNPFSYIRWGGSSNIDSVPAGASEAADRDSRGTTTYTSPMSGAGPKRSSLNQRKGWGSSGNVHTLRTDDDEISPRGNSYWNGNSTQFGGEDENKRD